MNGRRRIAVGVLSLACAVLLAIVVVQHLRAQPAGVLRTPYQAVLLSNGQVLFGKLERFGSPYPVLRDVYYIQSQVNPETKQVSNNLVRRGKEWHGPEVTVLNAQHVLLVESVEPDSQVAKLIEEIQKK